MLLSLIKSIGCLAFFLLLWTSGSFRNQCIQYFNRIEEYLFSHKKIILIGTLALYVVFIFFLQLHHETDGDEGEAWLIARDTTSLKQMYQVMGYEGTPGLWHTILFPFAKSGGSFSIIYVINEVFAIAAITIWLFFAPFPLLVRILLPFTHVFLTEYSVNARSYALSTCLLFAGLALYKNYYNKWLLWSIAFFLLANTNIHSTILCCGFALMLFLNWISKKNKTEGKALIIVSAGILLAIIQVLPPSDFEANLSQFKMIGHLKFITNRIVTGNPTLSNLLYFVFLIQIIRTIKDKIQLFALISIQLALFYVFFFIYFGGMRHHFFLFLSILMMLWIGDNKKNNAVTNLFLFGIQLLMISTAIILGINEWKYSGTSQKQMAAYIKAHSDSKTFIAAYPEVIINPVSPFLPKQAFYFPQANRWGTYSIWYQQGNSGSFNPNILQHIAVLPKSHPGFKNYFYLTIKPLPTDSIKYYYIELMTKISDSPQVRPSDPWKTYYLYRLPAN
jgi:hypothetical protein